MIDNEKYEELMEYVRQDNVKRFGTDKLILPFEPRCLTDALHNKKTLLEPKDDNV